MPAVFDGRGGDIAASVALDSAAAFWSPASGLADAAGLAALSADVGSATAGGVASTAVGGGPGVAAMLRSPGRATPLGGEFTPSPPRTESHATTPAISTLPATTNRSDLRRLPRGGIVFAPTAPVIVDGKAGCPDAGAGAARCDSIARTPCVRCFEIVACASERAYLATARTSSATFWNRRSGAFSRQR